MQHSISWGPWLLVSHEAINFQYGDNFNVWVVKQRYKWAKNRWTLLKISLIVRFHVTVRLFSNWSQMTSKCGKKGLNIGDESAQLTRCIMDQGLDPPLKQILHGQLCAALSGPVREEERAGSSSLNSDWWSSLQGTFLYPRKLPYLEFEWNWFPAKNVAEYSCVLVTKSTKLGTMVVIEWIF